MTAEVGCSEFTWEPVGCHRCARRCRVHCVDRVRYHHRRPRGAASAHSCLRWVSWQH